MTSLLAFLGGAALLVLSAEKLIAHLVGTARGLRIPLFLLAVVFTGVEFDDLTLGVALNLEHLGRVALGVVAGTAVSFSGIVLALAAIVRPSRFDVPRDYVVVFAAAPLLLIGFTLPAPLTVADGLVLLGLFAGFLGYVVTRELRRSVPVFRDAEVYETAGVGPGGAGGGGAPAGGATEQPLDDVPPAPRRSLPGWAHLGLAVVWLAGVVAGAATMSAGTAGVLAATGLDGTVFGATVVTAVLTAEDVFLTVEPFRRGVPEIGIGNVIGSVVFSVTGKLGITLLAGGIVVDRDVLTWHLPALVLLTGLAACFLWTGRLTRWHGCTLLALYLGYWVVSLVAFGGAPVPPD